MFLYEKASFLQHRASGSPYSLSTHTQENDLCSFMKKLVSYNTEILTR
jgi:hypothetical protein